MAVAEAQLLSPLKLAHLGDTVWELMIRSHLLYEGKNLRHMHQEAVNSVNAHAQAMALTRIQDLLTAQEADVVRRGRNAHSKHPAPKNQDPADYSAATGLEALMGFLYVTGQDERVIELFRLSREEENA